MVGVHEAEGLEDSAIPARGEWKVGLGAYGGDFADGFVRLGGELEGWHFRDNGCTMGLIGRPQ